MRDIKEIEQMQIVYYLPRMGEVSVQKDIVYKTVDDEDLMLDVYYPLDRQLHVPRPAVLFVHGGSQPEHVEYVRESRPYISWCQLVAASGVVAVMFKHRTDEGYSQLAQAGSDVDDLVSYIRHHGTSLGIDPDRLGIFAFSSGSIHGLRTALKGTPAYIRCITVYYGGMTLLNPKYFHFGAEEEALAKEFSPVYHLSQEDPTKIPPLFIAKAGLDRAFLNESIDECLDIANERNIPITFMNHPTGEHGFDIFNDDARSREIIKATLSFIAEHLG